MNLIERLHLASQGLTEADLDLSARALLDPATLSPDDTRTFAEKLGFKDGFLSAAVNLVTDPTVLIAMFLSSKFPTWQYIRGFIPHRFIGAANEFSGISTVARTVEGHFRGTNIPKLTGLYMQRKAEVMKVGNEMFDAFMLRPQWKTEMPVVSALLEGLSPSAATPELRRVADQIQAGMEKLWDLQKGTKQITGGFFDGDTIKYAQAKDFSPERAPRYLRDYLPHIPLVSADASLALSGREALSRINGTRFGQALTLANVPLDTVWKTGPQGTTSTYADFRRFMEGVGTQVFNPRLFKRTRDLTLQSAGASELFITDLNVILQRYVHSAAHTYALNTPLTQRERAIARTLTEDAAGNVRYIQPSEDPIIAQVINEGLDASGPAMLKRSPIPGTPLATLDVDTRLMNRPMLHALRTLTKNLMGRGTEDEIIAGNLVNSIRSRVNAVRSRFTGKQYNQMSDTLDIFEIQRKDRQWTNRITNFFYASTLGGNVGSAFRNLLQPVLTTMPAIGIGPTLKGYATVKDRLGIYLREAQAELRALKSSHPSLLERTPMAIEKGYAKAFPELYATGVRPDPRRFEFLDSEFMVPDKDAFTSLDRINEALMIPFTQAELANQVVTFYGAKEAGRQAFKHGLISLPEGVGLEEQLNFDAASVVAATQFRPGPGSKTVLQSMLPGWLRAFSGFPVRLGNWFMDSTVQGALTQKELQTAGFFERMLGGRNWGPLARTYLYGRVAAEGISQTLGVDVTDSLGIAGPFTGPIESGRLLNPLRIAPAPNVLFALASYASTGDIKELQPLTLPGIGDIPIPRTLIPGGVAISRASRAIRAFRPDMGGFVDDEERLMYEGDVPDLIFSALGFQTTGERRMRHDVEQLAAMEGKVRDYRRRLAVSLRNNDFRTADQLRAKYKEDFPDLPPLDITQRDRERYDQQARLTATARMLQTSARRFGFEPNGQISSEFLIP